ncbi:motility associated factor glycosyltransferase family protein [Salidesulfovibrio onnuriiensis]|uniref:motility associated factor glycosyltransferase family protein n=1 Tax=Salidesulfovibrio onnuriiensis TaxID=2583823 RepID=UPI0011CBDBCA|nr:6-hydroxymethylpterin diphosphokinase MptE-like protein [Salidesulfovibrio onnuriiensis]
MAGYPFLKKNLEIFEKIGHPLYAWLSSQKYDEQALHERLFENKWKIIDWKLDNGKGMFESMPPFSFYEKWIPGEKAHTSASIIVGCNVGYGLNHLLMNSPDSHKVIVVEPRPDVLMACLGQTDYEPFIVNKKLHFCVPDENYIYQVIKNLDLQYIYGQIHLRLDVPSQQIGPEYAQWSRIVKHKLENFTVELATLRFRQDTMVGNELKNFKRAMGDGSLLSLEGAAKGVGAVILGAGPSLAEYIPRILENRGYALYTTALQTMPILQKHGFKPDLCLAIDFDASMLKTYDRLDPEFAKDVPLIYSTKCNPELVKRYPGPTIPLWTVGGMGTFVMQGRELVLDAGGNVSLTLTRFLRWLQVSHIVLVGQDYAWSGGRTHSEGHHASRVIKEFNPRYHQKLTNAHGEEIYSSVQYLASKREMEDDIRKSNLAVFNLYGGGAIIEGTHMVDLEQAHLKGLLASAPGSVDTFMGRLHACRTSGNRLLIKAMSHEWTVSLRNVEKRLTKLFKKVGQNQNEIHKTLEQVELFVKSEPLYIPYLFNESIDMAGLTRAKHHYEPKDLGEFKRIAKNVLKKIREVDRCVAVDVAESAA